MLKNDSLGEDVIGKYQQKKNSKATLISDKIRFNAI